ncbi:TPA: hypothetical protein ACF3IV_000646 [Enterobacter hormaechei]
MNLNDLMSVIGVKTHEFELAPNIVVKIRMPSLAQYSQCTTPFKIIYHCVVDDEGKPLFESPEQIEENVELSVQMKLSQEIDRIFTESMNIDDIEKK